jgi:hypothetical protein
MPQLISGTVGPRNFNPLAAIGHGHQGALPLFFIKTKKPLIGGRNHFICSNGIYVLAQGEGSLRSFMCTLASVGHVEIYDQLIQEVPSKAPVKVAGGGTEWDIGRKVDEGEKRFMGRMSPPILGQWPLDANFKNGLVVRVSVGGAGSAPFLTFVWFLAEDMGLGLGKGVEK